MGCYTMMTTSECKKANASHVNYKNVFVLSVWGKKKTLYARMTGTNVDHITFRGGGDIQVPTAMAQWSLLHKEGIVRDQ